MSGTLFTYVPGRRKRKYWNGWVGIICLVPYGNTFCHMLDSKHLRAISRAMEGERPQEETPNSCAGWNRLNQHGLPAFGMKILLGGWGLAGRTKNGFEVEPGIGIHL